MKRQEIVRHLSNMARTGSPNEKEAIDGVMKQLRERLKERQARAGDTGSQATVRHAAPQLLPRPPFDKQ